MSRRTFIWLFILFGILSLIIAVWLYLNQLLLDPKQASSANKNWAMVFALIGSSISAGLAALKKSK